MKKITFLIGGLLLTFFATAQSEEPREISRDLKHFNRLVASPRINVVLTKGDREHVRLVYDGVAEHKINIDVRNHTLSIYLDNARKVEKMSPHYGTYGSRRSEYMGASITAYVTYTELEVLEIRGNQELTCRDEIESDIFKLRAYGENTITLAGLKTDYFKASMYGENTLMIRKGRVVEQKYKLYGENRIDTRDVRSAFAAASIFGVCNVVINSTEEVRLDAFGEPNIYLNGGAHVNKRLVFGKTSIYRH